MTVAVLTVKHIREVSYTKIRYQKLIRAGQGIPVTKTVSPRSNLARAIRAYCQRLVAIVGERLKP